MIRNNKGFTLIELMIAIAIIGIVTSAGGVSINMIYNAKVTTASRTIHSYSKSA